MSSGIIFGCLFKPLKEDSKVEKSGDLNGNINMAFDLGLYDEVILKDQKSGSRDVFEDNIESCMGAHLSIFKSLPMVLVMLSHLLLHLGKRASLHKSLFDLSSPQESLPPTPS